MKLAIKTIFILSIASVASAFAHTAAYAAGKNAAPFGLEIGVASCDDARAKLALYSEQKLKEGYVVVEAKKPSSVFEGATHMFALCRNGRVVVIQFEVSKGGMGNPSSRETFASLKQKYKLIAGGPMPNLGDGFARFSIGESIIEQSAPHMSSEYVVTYMEKGYYDSLMADDKAEKQKKRDKKQSSL